MAVQLVKVEGTDKLRDAARRLKEAGRTDLQRALTKAVRRTTAEAVDDLRQEVRGLDIDGIDVGLSERASVARASASGRGSGARARIEHELSRSRKDRERAWGRAQLRSGLREASARATTPTIQASAAAVRVRIRVARNKMPADQWRLPKYLNRGTWRHPVFGNREVWVAQTAAPPGWFDRTMSEHTIDIRAAIDREIDIVMAQL